MQPLDPSKLGTWYAAHARALSLYARQWGPEAEDAVHEAFIHLLSQRHEPANVRAWLFKAVRNGAISAARSNQRRQRREQTLAKERSQWFQPHDDDLLDAAAAQQALSTLPHEDREIIVMRIFAQMTLAEIAEIIGRPVSTVHDRYRTSLSTVRQQMESLCQKKTP